MKKSTLPKVVDMEPNFGILLITLTEFPVKGSPKTEAIRQECR